MPSRVWKTCANGGYTISAISESPNLADMERRHPDSWLDYFILDTFGFLRGS